MEMELKRHHIMAAFGKGILENLIQQENGLVLLKEVFLASSLTPKGLLAVAKSPHLTRGSMEWAIYDDIVFALYCEMRDNKDSKVYDALYKVSTEFFKETPLMRTYQSLVQKLERGEDSIVLPDTKYNAGSKAHFTFYFWILYEERKVGELIAKDMFKGYWSMLNGELSQDKASFSIDATFEFDDGAQLIDTKNYTRFRQQITEELVSYINRRYPGCKATEDNYTDIIAKHVHFGMHTAPKTLEIYSDKIPSLELSIFNSVAFLGQQNYNFSIDLLHSLMSDAGHDYVYMPNYHPDVPALVDLAIKAKIHEYTVREKKLTRGELNRVIKPSITDNIAVFYDNIVHLYYIDCLYNILEQVRDEYYYNFSWFYDIDKNHEETEEPVAASDVSPASDTVSDPFREHLQERYEKEREKVRSIGQSFQHELNARDKVIEADKKEIEKLKEQIQSYQDFTTLLSAEEVPESSEETDISVLYGKRFLFVGRISEAYPSLKKLFPKSVFMESETTNINSINVDAVVLFIRHMGHPMYYKVIQKFRGTKIPFVYINSRNINTIYAEMCKHLS